MNCNVNTAIKETFDFEKVHHFPACGDDGLSAGAALYVYHHILDNPLEKYKENEIVYLGKETGSFVEPDYDHLAKLIADGNVIAWFSGRSEFGPRALGNRSILSDPRSYYTRERLNFEIKNREWFRPYAPVVLEEESEKWFDFKGSSPYMLYTAQVLKPEIVPAATHIDGTARIQTINKEFNEPYYKLIKAFDSLTGVPMLINTSLNGNSEPILETEQDLLNFYNDKKVDFAVFNGRIIKV